jgi:tetratricopeptide (TPR) repeat protein
MGERIRVLAELAVGYALAGQPSEADRSCTAAEELCTQRGLPGRSEITLVSWSRGLVQFYSQRLDEAHASFNAGRPLAEAEGQPLRTAYLTYWLARTAKEKGDLIEAEAIVAQAMEAFSDMHHFYGAARCRHLMGTIALHADRPRYAVQMLQEALETFHSSGDPSVEAEALLDLAECYRSLGQRAQADRLCRSAVPLLSTLGDESGVRQAVSRLAPEAVALRRFRDVLQRVADRERR